MLHEFHELARTKKLFGAKSTARIVLIVVLVLVIENKFAEDEQEEESAGEIKIRTTHKIMAARTAQLALFIDQLVPALRTIPPVLAGNVFIR